ncbi:MAG: putative rRNA maturation factor [Candidatus Sumerlaeota bacterium]|nr:putative rRNA maturation factor [Candidatus Sumerlaeota bacterium]
MLADIALRFEQSGLRRGRARLQRHAQALLTRVLDDLGWPHAALTVLFCSDARIRALNREFRGIDAPTDVLSFPAAEDIEALRGEQAPYLGDLAVSLAYTARQAREAGRALDAEVSLLLVHGALHLLGWDHDTAARERRMWREQDRLLALAADIPAPEIEFDA